MGTPAFRGSPSPLARIWSWLIDPSDSLVDGEIRRRARLLSALLVASLVLGVIAVYLTVLDMSARPENERRDLIQVPVISVLFIAAVYFLSRTRLYRTAAAATVGIFLVSTFLAFIYNPAQAFSLAFLVLGGLICSLFLSTRSTILVFLATMIGTAFLPALVPTLTALEVITSLFFTFTVGVVIVVTTTIREADLERINLQAETLADREVSLSAALMSADQANDRLKELVGALERNNREAALLADMGNLLNLSARLDEAYEVIANSARQLFPLQAGALYMFSESRDDLDPVTVWSAQGYDPPGESALTPPACWALRRGQIHRVESDHPNVLCQHLPDPPPSGYMCIPMVSQGEVFGIFHVRTASGSTGLHLNEALAANAAEQMTLALTNIKLRETLRNQSIRDPLTGLFNQRYMIETLARELTRADRHRQPLGVAMLDVDHFKQYNDTFGHEAGDLVMKDLGRIIQSSVRSSDIA